MKTANIRDKKRRPSAFMVVKRGKKIYLRRRVGWLARREEEKESGNGGEALYIIKQGKMPGCPKGWISCPNAEN
jgi:predicted DNA-binding ArsR family transcriptional regulator